MSGHDLMIFWITCPGARKKFLADGIENTEANRRFFPPDELKAPDLSHLRSIKAIKIKVYIGGLSEFRKFEII